MNENTSLEKYTSHTLFYYERVMCEKWVGDLTNCNILTPGSFVFSSTFSFCWAAQSGVLRAHSPLLGAGSLYSILSPIKWTSGLYHCLPSTCFLHPIQPVHSQGYTLISYTSSYSSRAITFTFGQIPLGKVWNPLSSQLWVK